MRHRGRAVVFENIEHYKTRIDDPDLDVDEDCVLVLKNCGPKGYPGMAEVGNMGLPPKLLQRGVTDMVRISDARMSGTAYGTVVLHVCPEAAVGGPLALVRDGDIDRARRRATASCTWTSRTRSSRAGAPTGARPQPPGVTGGYRAAVRRARAAGGHAAPISISWSAAADTRCRESRIRSVRGSRVRVFEEERQEAERRYWMLREASWPSLLRAEIRCLRPSSLALPLSRQRRQ